MAIKKLGDTASEADWSFLEIPGVMNAIVKTAKAKGLQYGVDSDDLFQEAVMALAVRPALVKSAIADSTTSVAKLLSYRAGMFMITRAETMNKHATHNDYPEADVWWDGNTG